MADGRPKTLVQNQWLDVPDDANVIVNEFRKSLRRNETVLGTRINADQFQPVSVPAPTKAPTAVFNADNRSQDRRGGEPLHRCGPQRCEG